MDEDIEALEFAGKVKPYRDRVVLVKSNFADLKVVLQNLGFNKVTGVFFDLGVSSHQVDTTQRGFSFNKDNFLDMRMDLSKKLHAHYIVNHYSEKQLTEIFSKYGEERFSRSLARLIALERKKNPIETTNQLAELVINFYAKHKKGKWRIHPATKIFQAIRIEVNKELSSLEEALWQAVKNLEAGGRIGVISYHSLEDRIVKISFGSGEEEIINQYGYGLKNYLKNQFILQKRVKQNPRARSAD